MKKQLFLLFLALVVHQGIRAQDDAFIGEVRMFAGNFPPRGWMFCEGQSLSIAQYTTLYVLLGTTYGGDGITTFNLPDMRGRVGTHPNSSNPIGKSGGSETVLLTTDNIPPHSHAATSIEITASTLEGTSTSPQGKVRAVSGTNAYSSTTNTTMTSSTSITSKTGEDMPIDNVQPYLTINYIICFEGIFPSRSN